MKLLEKLTRKPKIFQRILGLSAEQLNCFVKHVEPLWHEAEQERKYRENRKREIGGGRPYEHSLKEMIVVVLLYYKAYLTQEFVGVLCNIDQSNVSRLLKKMLPLIEEAADPSLTRYLSQAKEEFDRIPKHQRIADWEVFLKRHPDIKEASIDATEQQCYRSSHYKTQKQYYSGKSKQHALKTQISVAQTGRILDISATVPGSIHDKKLVDQEKTPVKFPEKTAQRYDAGYQGVKAEYPEKYIISTIKKEKNKERSALDIELNRINSKRRVIVEHAIARIKKFKIIAGLYRGEIKDYNKIFRNVAALLNFRLIWATSS